MSFSAEWLWLLPHTDSVILAVCNRLSGNRGDAPTAAPIEREGKDNLCFFSMFFQTCTAWRGLEWITVRGRTIWLVEKFHLQSQLTAYSTLRHCLCILFQCLYMTCHHVSTCLDTEVVKSSSKSTGWSHRDQQGDGDGTVLDESWNDFIRFDVSCHCMLLYHTRIRLIHIAVDDNYNQQGGLK